MGRKNGIPPPTYTFLAMGVPNYMKSVADLVLELRDEFTVDVLDETRCRDWFLNKLHPEGVHCPGCGAEITSSRKLSTFWELGRVTCPKETCKKSFSALTGTALNGVGIPFRALYLLLFMAGCGISANRIAPQLGIATGTAYIWAKKAKPGKETLDA